LIPIERFNIEKFVIFSLIDACEAQSLYWVQYLPRIEEDDAIDNERKRSWKL